MTLGLEKIEKEILIFKEYEKKNMFNLNFYKKKNKRAHNYSSSIIRDFIKSGNLEQANSIFRVLLGS